MVWLGSLTENWPLLFLAVAALVLLQQEMLKAIMSDSRSRLPGVLLINLLALILCLSLIHILYEKEVDGFFIDNCDVYYYAPRKDIFDGLTVILQYIMTLGKEVIINGGDTYVTEYKERYGTIDPVSYTHLGSNDAW